MNPNNNNSDKRINARRPFWRQFWAIFTVIFSCSLIQGMIFGYQIKMGVGIAHMVASGLISIFVLVLIVSLLSRAIGYIVFTKPIMELVEAARRVATGDFTVQVKTQRNDDKKDELEVLIDDFNKMVKGLSTIETMKEDFIANISHEIKTPLSIIKSYAVSLRNPNLDETEKEAYIDTIVEASDRLSGLVSDVLRLNKLENLEITKRETYSLDEQLRRCILSLEEKLDEKEINLDVDLEEIYINSDKSLLEIVWNNLLNNAIKFTDIGGDIKVETHRFDNIAEIKIIDNGCGMDEQTISHMFDRFYQGDISHHMEGNGLGLSIVKRIIDIVGAEIFVDSNYGKGTIFTIKIPC